jgi:hypothetical protein
MPDTLPASLQNFLALAPPLPPVDSSGGGVPSVATAPATVAPVPGPVAMPAAPVPQPAKVSKAEKISSEFDLLDPIPSTTPSSTPSTSSASAKSAVRSEEEIGDAVDGIKAAARKAVAAHEEAMESAGRTYSSLSGLRQRLATEKISLEATVASAAAASSEASGKLEQVLAEINRHQEQLQELRGKLALFTSNQVDSQEKLSKANSDKARLLREIEDTLKQLQEASQGSAGYAAKVCSSPYLRLHACSCASAAIAGGCFLGAQPRDRAEPCHVFPQAKPGSRVPGDEPRECHIAECVSIY